MQNSLATNAVVFKNSEESPLVFYFQTETEPALALADCLMQTQLSSAAALSEIDSKTCANSLNKIVRKKQC